MRMKIALNNLLLKIKRKHPISMKQLQKNQKFPNYQAMMQAQEIEKEAEANNSVSISIIIDLLLDLQALGEDSLVDQMRTPILQTIFKIRQYLKKDYPEIKSLLSIYGDPDEQIMVYEKEQFKNYPPMLTSGTLAIQAPVNREDPRILSKRSIVGYKNNLGNRSALVEGDLSLAGNHMNEVEDSKGQLVPYYGSRIDMEISTKALKDIEKIKNAKKERELQKLYEINQKREREKRTEKKMKEQLERRKIELGVGTRNQKDLAENILLSEGQLEEDAKKRKKIQPEIELIDFTCCNKEFINSFRKELGFLIVNVILNVYNSVK